MKNCFSCKKIKNLTDFNKNKSEKSGYNTYCRDCQKEYKLLYRYKITKDFYDTLSKSQNGKCKICNKKTKLVVDHCHKKGHIRGLLCTLCNKGLGHFKDNLKLFKNAINYLEKHNVNKN